MSSVSISMPSSSTKRVLFRDQDGTIFDSDIANPTTSGTKQGKFHCQSMPTGSAFDEAVAASGLFPSRLLHLPTKNPRIERPRDKSFDSFKTFSGKLEGQLSNLRGKSPEIGQEANTVQNVEVETLPAHRYFDALEGPELDTLRAVRVNFFRGFRFSLAWWAYTFPMTGAAIATINYSAEVPNVATKSLSVLLSAISILVVTLLLVTTILHAFVLRDLFPNDIAIAITDRRPKAHHQWFHRRTGSPDKDIENCLNCMKLDGKDIAASI